MHPWRLRNPIRTSSLAALALCAIGLWAQAPEQPEVRAHESAPPFQIRVETNLVTVRVVVRDAQGQPVRGLRREDFRLFDNGKPRIISGFEVEAGAANPASAGRPDSSAGTASASPTPFPQRFVTLFFDDLHLDDSAVVQTRNAGWHYIETAVQPDDRVGIVTSSGQTGIDFTADRGKLHDVLFKVAGHSRTIPIGRQCPAISEYQAYLMEQRQQNDAIDIAAAEGYECRCKGLNDTPECADGERRMAVAQAAQIWNLADDQSLRTLDLMDAVVNRMSAMPGQRVLVLVSAGFLTATRGKMVDALIDRALRQKIVVNAIDAAGLYTRDPRERILTGRPDLQSIKNRIENEGLSVQRDVLAGVAAGTGGTYFHNSNDFNTGFRDTAQAPEVTYILSFSLADVKLDGRFHSLKVALNTGSGYDIQARRGYFATAPAQEVATRSEIESLIYSQEERQDFPATVTARWEASALRVTIHVDIQSLQFRQEGDRNINTLTFDTAVFDRDGKYVAGKESTLDFRLPDGKLEKLRQSGINAETRFRVAPGAYRLREVVRDGETKKMAVLNANAEASAAPAGEVPNAPNSPNQKKAN
jgi:VWFA-related protein